MVRSRWNPLMDHVNVTTSYRTMMMYMFETLCAPLFFPARHLSDICHAISSSRQFTQMKANMTAFKPQEVALPLWAFVKMNYKHDTVSKIRCGD